MVLQEQFDLGELKIFHNGQKKWTIHLLEECYKLASDKVFLYSKKKEIEIIEYCDCLNALKDEIQNLTKNHLNENNEYISIWKLAHKFQEQMLENWAYCYPLDNVNLFKDIETIKTFTQLIMHKNRL